MPPKRPLEENPPSASASDEESESDEEGSEEEQEAPKPIQPSTKSIPPKPPSSSDDEDDDDEEEEDVEEEKPKPTAEDDNEEDDDDDDSESGSGSESDNEPVKHMIAPRTAEVKPISSKPMSDIPKSKKPTSTNTAPAKPKRPSEEEEENDKKRKKKKVADIDDGGDEESQKKAAAGEEKKQPFQRVWTNEDEIILLNSLKDFKREGHNAANDMAGFHDFVKDSLHIDVTKAQLANKIQRLEKKFRNNASRSKEPGKDPVISKPHEWKSYQLSKEIWGDQSGKDNGAETNNVGGEAGVTEKKRRRTQVKNNGVASPKRKVAKPVKSPKVEHMKEEDKEDNVKEEDGAGGTVEYPYLNQSMQILNHPVLPVPPQGLVGLFAKKGWDLIGTSKAETFDQKWKALLITETKAYLERLDVVRDQTKLMLEVLESSNV